MKHLLFCFALLCACQASAQAWEFGGFFSSSSSNPYGGSYLETLIQDVVDEVSSWMESGSGASSNSLLGSLSNRPVLRNWLDNLVDKVTGSWDQAPAPASPVSSSGSTLVLLAFALLALIAWHFRRPARE